MAALTAKSRVEQRAGQRVGTLGLKMVVQKDMKMVGMKEEMSAVSKARKWVAWLGRLMVGMKETTLVVTKEMTTAASLAM